MVSSAVEMAGGFAGLIRDGQTVVIKPNLVIPIDYTLPNWNGKPLAPEVNGTTTDYRVTRAIVELVRRYNPNGKVYVMEGSAFSTRWCMRQLNYTPEYIPGVDEFICIEEDSGAWRDYNSPKIVKVPVKDPLLTKKQWDPAAVGYLGYLEKSGAGKCNVAKIRVVGQQVDDVRQDFKGTAPQGKFGKQAPPQIEIKSTAIKDDILTVTLAAASQTVKIEVYVGGNYLGTVAPRDPQKWTIKVKGMTSDRFKTDIILKCYDKYLNCTEKQLRVSCG